MMLGLYIRAELASSRRNSKEKGREIRKQKSMHVEAILLILLCPTCMQVGGEGCKQQQPLHVLPLVGNSSSPMTKLEKVRTNWRRLSKFVQVVSTAVVPLPV